MSLKPGSVNETVTVSSLPTVLETETSSRGQVIGTQEIENLPLNGRSYADLALLAPGVRKSFLENQSTTSREASFNVNGQRSAFNNFLLNGLDNNSYGTSNQGFANENIPPSPDAVSEFRLETDNYSAEYGRASGAVINASIRRGANKFHGRAWDYIRNTSLNAIGPFAPNGGIKPTFIRNQFGGTFGGPIWKDHTFFFMDYEGVRQIFKSFATATLPTAEQRTGTFPPSSGQRQHGSDSVTNPITGKVYTNGIIPISDQTVLATSVFAALPATNTSALPGTPNSFANNFTNFPRGTIQDDKGDARVDHTFNPNSVCFLSTANTRRPSSIRLPLEDPLVAMPIPTFTSTTGRSPLAQPMSSRRPLCWISVWGSARIRERKHPTVLALQACSPRLESRTACRPALSSCVA